MFESLEAKRLLILAGSLVLMLVAVSGMRSREYTGRDGKRMTGWWAVAMYFTFFLMSLLGLLAFISFPENLAFFCLSGFLMVPFGVVIHLFAPHRPA